MVKIKPKSQDFFFRKLLYSAPPTPLGAFEINPLSNYLLSNGLLVPAKTVVTILLLACFALTMKYKDSLSKSKYYHVSLTAVAMSVVFYTIVCVNNSYWLLLTLLGNP